MGSDGETYLELDPTSNAVAGDQVTVNEALYLDSEGLEAIGSLSGTVALRGDCIGGEGVPHTLTVTWNFPLHDERTTRVANEVCCGPWIGLR